MAKQAFHVCHHCKDRKIGCHADCEAYLKEKEQYNEIKEKDKNERTINNAI